MSGFLDFLGEGPSSRVSKGSDSLTSGAQHTKTQNRTGSSGSAASTGTANTTGTTSNTSTNLSSIADWMRPHAQGALSMGKSVANKAFERYTPNSDRINQFTNPHTEAVLAPTLREINRAASDDRYGLSSRAANAGAFGGARHGILEARGDENRLRNIADATAKVHSQAYDQALGMDRGEHQRGQEWDSARLGDYLAAVSGVPMDRSQTATSEGATQQATSKEEQSQQQQQQLSEVEQLLNSSQQKSERGFGTEKTDSSTMGTLTGLAGLVSTIGGLFSDENMKKSKRKMSGDEILALLDEVEPGQEWEYKHQPGVKRIGPMAQDMQKHMGIGNGRMLPPNEMASTALAGVKALHDKIEKLEGGKHG